MRVKSLKQFGCGTYAVREDGMVFNSTRLSPVKPQVSKKGYARVSLFSDAGLHRKFSVHRLVASCFIENPDGKPHVNHVDYNRLNNKATNLEWVTPKENTAHSLDNLARGEQHGNCKLTNEEIQYIKHSDLPLVTLSQMYEISRQSVAYWKKR